MHLGWIYTRLLDHGTELLGKLHEYELEALILQKLINQRCYRLGKRGKWYDRLALVQSKYLNKDQVRVQKKLALKTCIDAIHDPRVHQSKKFWYLIIFLINRFSPSIYTWNSQAYKSS